MRALQKFNWQQPGSTLQFGLQALILIYNLQCRVRKHRIGAKSSPCLFASNLWLADLSKALVHLDSLGVALSADFKPSGNTWSGNSQLMAVQSALSLNLSSSQGQGIPGKLYEAFKGFLKHFEGDLPSLRGLPAQRGQVSARRLPSSHSNAVAMSRGRSITRYI